MDAFSTHNGQNVSLQVLAKWCDFDFSTNFVRVWYCLKVNMCQTGWITNFVWGPAKRVRNFNLFGFQPKEEMTLKLNSPVPKPI